VRARVAAQGVKIRMPRGGQFSRAVDTKRRICVVIGAAG
jgi:hypothetical protein